MCSRAPLDHVGDQAHRRVDREAPLLLGDVLLEDVGLDRAAEPLGRDALALGGHDVEREHDRGRGVDRHRDGDLVRAGSRRTASPCRRRVSTATPSRPTSPRRARVVGVVAHQRGHVERRREPGLAVVEQVVEALVRLLGACRSRRTGASSTAARGTSTDRRPRVYGYWPGSPIALLAGQIGRGVQRFDLLAGEGRRRTLALR